MSNPRGDIESLSEHSGELDLLIIGQRADGCQRLVEQRGQRGAVGGAADPAVQLAQRAQPGTTLPAELAHQRQGTLGGETLEQSAAH